MEERIYRFTLAQRLYTGIMVIFSVFLIMQSVALHENILVFIPSAAAFVAFILFFIPSSKFSVAQGTLLVILLLINTVFSMYLNGEEKVVHLLYAFSPLLLLLYLKRWVVAAAGIMNLAVYMSVWYYGREFFGDFFPESVVREDLAGNVMLQVFLLITAYLVAAFLEKNAKTEYEKKDEKAEEEDLYLSTIELERVKYLKNISEKIFHVSGEIKEILENDKNNLLIEKTRLKEIESVVNSIIGGFSDTIGAISETRDIINQITTLAGSANGNIEQIVKMVQEMLKFVDVTRKSIFDLGAATKKVQGIIVVIDKVSTQTRLLSLNASIEGARFSEHQMGFAMVAREVKQLAAITQNSVQEITATIREIKKKIRDIHLVIEVEIKEAVKGMEVARLMDQSAKHVVTLLGTINSEVDTILNEMKDNQGMAKEIGENFSTIAEFVRHNYEQLELVMGENEEINLQAKHLSSLIQVNVMTEDLNQQNDQIYTLVSKFFTEFEEEVSRGVKAKKITEELLLKEDYQSVSEEGWFTTPSLSFMKVNIQGLIDSFCKSLDNIFFIALMDNQGYVPIVSVKDDFQGMKYHPGKKHYQKEVRDALKSNEIYHLQTVFNEKKNPMIELSVPLMVGDYRWGLVLVGFKYK